MNTQEMLATCFGLVLFAAVLLSPAACTANRHNQIAKAIEAGAAPLEAKCAIESENNSSLVCALTATRSTK